ncbi:hypothetical protein B0T20DRAFT_395163 [Sordaria brevicollis]|uniref:Uncharacterized protein n=1 Tax=Sordaria brevicollis TaxID=83679 RepID=A0AAE0UAA2_SORBR|nr:hypothetical protein B0T20DRAFT_395163 [Sordaria brevicollis]
MKQHLVLSLTLSALVGSSIASVIKPPAPSDQPVSVSIDSAINTTEASAGQASDYTASAIIHLASALAADNPVPAPEDGHLTGDEQEGKDLPIEIKQDTPIQTAPPIDPEAPNQPPPQEPPQEPQQPHHPHVTHDPLPTETIEEPPSNNNNNGSGGGGGLSGGEIGGIIGGVMAGIFGIWGIWKVFTDRGARHADRVRSDEEYEMRHQRRRERRGGGRSVW